METWFEVIYVSLAVLAGVCLMSVFMHRCLSNDDQRDNDIEVDATPAVATRIDHTDDSDPAQYTQAVVIA